jgi:AcrR family transcriptional regulator
VVAAAPALPPDVRASILEVATRLFASHGFDGTALQEIAEAVGIRKPSLLYHFASKDELRQAVLDDVLARWKDTLPQVLLAATAGQAQFDAITRELLSFFSQDPDRARLLLREALDRPREMSVLLSAHVRPVVANLAGYVRAGQQAGRVHADVDPEAYLFQAIVLLLSGVAFSSSFAGLMPARSANGRAEERLEHELLRMAKSSLFGPETTTAPVRTGARAKKRERSGDRTLRRRPGRHDPSR